MVLEDATSPPANDGFSSNDTFDTNPDPTPATQNDPNDPRSPLLYNANGVHLDLRSVHFDGMQRPWVASWTQSAHERWTQRVYREVPPLVAELQKPLPRALDGDELQVLSGHMVRYLALKENLSEIAVDAGIVVAVSVMRSMRRRKDPRGFAFKALRVGSFAALTALGIEVAGALTLAPFVSTAMMQDSRLVAFNRDLKVRLIESKQVDRQPRAGPSSRERWQTPSLPRRGDTQDDASPASDPHADYNPISSSSSSSSTVSQTSAWNTPEPQRQAQQQEEPFDDASPSQQPPPPDDSTPSESTWDRVRRLANEQSQNPPSVSSQDSWGRPPVIQRGRNDSSSASDAEDSFAFSTADEERQLAKSEAQKEFDARIERERQGGDFDEKKRW
jgi:hypothetical protein